MPTKKYYLLRNFDLYGSYFPICVEEAEAKRLMIDGDPNETEFDEIWREATQKEIEKYGISVFE